MPEFTTRRAVRHSAAQMFDLVADVERYPEFVPLCRSVVVRRRSTDAEGCEVLVASMEVAYKLMHESFTTRVALDRGNREIRVEYLEGPFSRLDNRWSFDATGATSCEVTFFISYEFKSRMLSMLMGGVFDAAFRRFTEAFEQRADVVYGI